MMVFFFDFRPFPSGVATADVPYQVVPVLCILLRHFNLSHVYFHHIHEHPFWPSPSSLSWLLHPQRPSTNIPIIFPPYMSKPPQPCLTRFLSKPSHLSYPSDVLNGGLTKGPMGHVPGPPEQKHIYVDNVFLTKRSSLWRSPNVETARYLPRKSSYFAKVLDGNRLQ